MKSRFLLLILFISAAGCVKETYNMDKLSPEISYSPVFGVSAAKGDISLKDILKPNDTIVFDSDNLVRLVFKKDSVIDFRLKDYFDLTDMVSFSEKYTMGELSLSPFSASVAFPVNQISAKFSPPVTYSDGTYPGFPSFPQIDIGELSYTPFSNFKSATFSAGTIDFTIVNNLPVTIGGLTIRLFNAANHTQIGNDLSVAPIAAGGTGIASLNLKNLTISNSLAVGVIIHATTGTTSPVQINTSTTNLEVTVSGKNLKVKSGQVILPSQTVASLDGSDTIDFDPGSGIELTDIKMKTGSLTYTIQGNTVLNASVSLTLPTATRDGVALTETINLIPQASLSGDISMSNSTTNLATITTKPYNSIPVNYTITVSSNDSYVNFNSSDEITMDLKLDNPDFDYVKGYFGQESESIDEETLDLGIKDVLSNIDGEFYVANPIIRLNYSNSFAIPIKVDLKATGYRDTKVKNLGLLPFTLAYPGAPAERDKSAVFSIDKNNSGLADIISMPPEKITFSGSAMMNPDGNDGSRGNYIFGNSRFLGSLEVEVPFEFRLNNLQFADTIDNFLKNTNTDNGSIGPEDFEYLKVKISAENGFPVGLSLSMSLFDSATGKIKNTINASDILKPAAVDAGGKVTTPAVSETLIDIQKDFWNNINNADEMIVKFAVNTTGSESAKNVKIYSDYSINFNVSLVAKPDLKINLKKD